MSSSSSSPLESVPTKENLEFETSYEVAANYWSGVPATVDGMLGGFGSISRWVILK